MKVLVAGTDSNTLSLLKTAVSSLGDEVCLCENAAGVRRHCRNDAYPLLILEDMLPDRDGFELCAEIRSELRDAVKVILVIAGRASAEWSNLMTDGPDDILFHPLEHDTLTIHLRLAKKRISREKQRIRTTQALVTAIETMQLGITVTGTDGSILYSNAADAAMHGYKGKELIGQNARLFSPSVYWNWMSVDQINRLGSWKRESVNVRKDGTVFPVQLLSDVVRDEEDSVVGIITTCEDISERKRAEELRRNSEQRFHERAQAAAVLMWMNYLVTGHDQHGIPQSLTEFSTDE